MRTQIYLLISIHAKSWNNLEVKRWTILVDVLRTVNITRGNDEKFQQITDKVIREYSLTIIFNQQELVTLLCSPMHVDELAVGYIYNEGLIRDRDDISKIEYIDNNICITTSNETAITLKKQHKIITVSSGTILSKPNIKSLPVNTSTNKVLYRKFTKWLIFLQIALSCLMIQEGSIVPYYQAVI